MEKNGLFKTVKCLIFVFALFVGYTLFSLRNTEKTAMPTQSYSQMSVNSAMNTVARHFTLHYPDCKLMQLYVVENSEREDGTLIIYSDFYVGTNEKMHPSMEPDEIYKKWQFEMKNVLGLWFVTNNGYG